MLSLIFPSYDHVFFFKQKTAYEITHSDWSSDVCSSDLCELEDRHVHEHHDEADGDAEHGHQHRLEGASEPVDKARHLVVMKAGDLAEHAAHVAAALADGHHSRRD